MLTRVIQLNKNLCATFYYGFITPTIIYRKAGNFYQHDHYGHDHCFSIGLA